MVSFSLSRPCHLVRWLTYCRMMEEQIGKPHRRATLTPFFSESRGRFEFPERDRLYVTEQELLHDRREYGPPRHTTLAKPPRTCAQFQAERVSLICPRLVRHAADLWFCMRSQTRFASGPMRSKRTAENGKEDRACRGVTTVTLLNREQRRR